ncbi:hypothetical protein [Nostoc favosum]|uniref:Uncharacterized protein n=1 Tax=Nostoc favosum CHAB5714 TaxID=2780399 RepID=A0ABS8IHN3_9NOSO|nr:hypothetical protein [Nostoc favosum]MCC5603702.1 hypothetical protein [Nostoc favosum CHAB5714]
MGEKQTMPHAQIQYIRLSNQKASRRIIDVEVRSQNYLWLIKKTTPNLWREPLYIKWL